MDPDAITFIYVTMLLLVVGLASAFAWVLTRKASTSIKRATSRRFSERRHIATTLESVGTQDTDVGIVV